MVKGFVDSSVFLSVYLMDQHYAWASKQLDSIGTAFEPVTCDLCVGEVVTNIVERPGRGDSVWHDAVLDLCERLKAFEILRASLSATRCARAIVEIIDVQWKDKVWLSSALHAKVTHLYTTDKPVWENQPQLTKASGLIKGQAVKVHSPYVRQ